MAKKIQRSVDVDPIWRRFAGLSEGHFEALVRLRDNYRPDYMTILGPFTPGVLKAEIPSAALPHLAVDERVLGVEFREFVVA